MHKSTNAKDLRDPSVREMRDIVSTCVHCGYCLPSCSSYVILGNEFDSPRGRIHLIQDMLLQKRGASEKLTRHIDNCLSCMSCVTICPSGVDYMHLVDFARVHIERTYRRPLTDRLLRATIAFAFPRPIAFRLMLKAGKLAQRINRVLPKRVQAMLSLMPKAIAPRRSNRVVPTLSRSRDGRRRRVALMTGCVQQVLRPEIDEATARVLERLGCEVIVAKDAGCCGALAYHMGKEKAALQAARRNIAAWRQLMDKGGLDAIVINASGCGTTVKDYGWMFRHDPQWAKDAHRVARIANDVSEFILGCGTAALTAGPSAPAHWPNVAYHSACSLQHGQRLRTQPLQLLRQLGFTVTEPDESHICCGSAGTYAILHPTISRQLRERKASRLKATGAQVVATGNIGCLVQLSGAVGVPVVHTIELVDWVTGGPRPMGLSLDGNSV
jgi:glycolate dehydrogenase iron-sulfur subunit